MKKENEEKTEMVIPNVESAPIEHNLAGLRDALFEEMNLLRSNQIPIARARTTANIAKRIIEAATLELVFKKQIEANSAEDLKRLLKDH